MVLMLPLGIVYFTIAVTGISVSIAMVAAPVAAVLAQSGMIEGGIYLDGQSMVPPIVLLPFTLLLGIVLPFALLHLARAIARFQGALAKHLLVRSAG
jgi:hypothetical protein